MSDGDPILVAVWVGVKPTIQQTWLVRSEAWATSHTCSDLLREVLEEKGPPHLLEQLPESSVELFCVRDKFETIGGKRRRSGGDSTCCTSLLSMTVDRVMQTTGAAEFKFYIRLPVQPA